MAVVYRGIDEVLGRTVAIKTMLPQYAADPSFAARFKQEAQAAAALSSPYIVNVYDWGKDGDTYYIVMEYLRGTDLKSGIRRAGALDCRKVAQIGSQIAKALSVAHRHEIIHRDIKPQNIMVLTDGNIKVMDFGIARAKNSHLTQDNSVLGTAHYVSPEQTQGKELGPTTDIYSLGIVMYEAVTGRVPFDGDDAISVALKQVNEQPMPPSQINQAVDPSLEAIILKCMQKDPADRFQTAGELEQVLHDYMAGRYQAVNEATSVIGMATTNVISGEAQGVQPVDPTSRSRTGTITTKPRTAHERARQEAEQRAKKRKRRFVVILLCALVALGAAGYAAWTVFSSRPQTKDVPNILNMTEEEAKKAIEDTDFFAVGATTSEYSTTVEKGHVLEQDPDAGRSMPRNTKINIVVSLGEKPKNDVTVPDLRNKSVSEAQEALEKLGLVGKGGDAVFDDEVESGKVALQSPAAGTAAKEGDIVTYQISKGAEEVEVPEVVGDYEADAVAQLEGAGFVVSKNYGKSNYYDEGIVSSQSATGTAKRGSTITISISTGRAEVEIPNVVGFDEGSAVETLESMGFYVSVETEHSSSIPEGTVISQSKSGTTSADDMSITIYVSNGPEETTTDTPTESDTPESGEESGGENESDDDASGDHSDESTETTTPGTETSTPGSETTTESETTTPGTETSTPGSETTTHTTP